MHTYNYTQKCIASSPWTILIKGEALRLPSVSGRFLPTPGCPLGPPTGDTRDPCSRIGHILVTHVGQGVPADDGPKQLHCNPN